MKSFKDKAFLSLTSAAAFLLSVGDVSAQAAQSPKLPTTPEDNYAVAQKFAHCSGHFAFAAFIANRNGLTDATTAFGDMQRGWRLAGMAFLAESMSEGRTSETEKTFDYLVSAKVTVMKAKFEIDPKGSNLEFQKEYQDNCIPWINIQKKIIEIMRRGS